jgi:tetratricopeptide (TPR) repeat protein
LYHDLGNVNSNPVSYEAAIEALERSVKIEPQNAYSQTNLGNAYKKLALSRNDRDPNSPLWRKALEHLKTAVAMDGTEGSLHYNLGLAYYELGQRKEARRNFEVARRVEPKFAQAYLALGLMANEDGNLPSAVSELEQCVILDANKLEAIRLLADIHVMKQQDYPGAKMLLEFAVKKFPANSDLRRRLGVVYQMLGRSAEACDQLKVALRLAEGAKGEEIRELLDSFRCK